MDRLLVTRDDIIRGGACIGGVHEWAQNNLPGLTAAPIEVVLKRTSIDIGETILLALSLDGYADHGPYGEPDRLGNGRGGGNYGSPWLNANGDGKGYYGEQDGRGGGIGVGSTYGSDRYHGGGQGSGAYGDPHGTYDKHNGHGRGHDAYGD